MIEKIEFRIPEENAKKILSCDEGVKLGDTVRKLVIHTKSPLFNQIWENEIEARKNDNWFFSFWNITRHYTEEEIQSASLFKIIFQSFTEDASEFCGSSYSNNKECPICGCFSELEGDFFLNIKKIPKSCDITRTIAEEWIISERLLNLLYSNDIKGFQVKPVIYYKKKKNNFSNWFYFKVISQPIDIHPQTQFGVSPFIQDNQYVCPLGHSLGFRILSELFIKKETWNENDLSITRQFYGLRMNATRPTPFLVISKKLYDIFVANKVKGCRYEIAHLV